METNAQQTLDLALMILDRPSLTDKLLRQAEFLEMLGEREVASKVRNALMQVTRIMNPIQMEYNLIMARLENKTIENLWKRGLTVGLDRL